MTSTLNQLVSSNHQAHQAIWFPASVLGWKQPRRVAYIHRHPQLQDLCLYFWNHQEKTPEPTQAQEITFLLEDIYAEARGEFAAQKLVVDADLGADGRLRLISGLNTTCAATLLSSLCALSPELLKGPLSLRLRPGNNPGVVMASLFVDHEWVDGRALRRGERGDMLSSTELLTEIQTLLKHALSVEHLPHQIRQTRSQTV